MITKIDTHTFDPIRISYCIIFSWSQLLQLINCLLNSVKIWEKYYHTTLLHDHNKYVRFSKFLQEADFKLKQYTHTDISRHSL